METSGRMLQDSVSQPFKLSVPLRGFFKLLIAQLQSMAETGLVHLSKNIYCKFQTTFLVPLKTFLVPAVEKCCCRQSVSAQIQEFNLLCSHALALAAIACFVCAQFQDLFNHHFNYLNYLCVGLASCQSMQYINCVFYLIHCLAYFTINLCQLNL